MRIQDIGDRVRKRLRGDESSRASCNQGNSRPLQKMVSEVPVPQLSMGWRS